MFWWRGRGIWVLGIGALFVLPFEKAGGGAMALGWAVAALVVFLLNNWFGEESSMFSIPTRFWPVLFLGMALLTAAGGTRREATADGPRALGQAVGR